ncbi:response regulator transcription factor [Streptomyces olivaceoviridis]
MIESQIIRIGMEGILRELACVGRVETYEPECLDVLLDAPPDILIITFDEWRVLAESTEGTHTRLPHLLVLGDEPYEWSGELFAALPVDGFLSLQKLSAQSAGESLLRTVTGQMPMPPALARRLLTANKVRISGSAVRSVSLTSRESEALSLLADGLSNKQIARKLGISIHGAKRLVGSILLKLGAPNRTGAVVTAQKAGLV